MFAFLLGTHSHSQHAMHIVTHLTIRLMSKMQLLAAGLCSAPVDIAFMAVEYIVADLVL